MLFKLSFRNIKRSMRDFTIYFVTIVLGIATFYAFDSLSCQRVLFDIQTTRVDMWDTIDYLMKMFGVVVTFVLCALILYANNFLLKRRKSEFGTYMVLGMSPGRVSQIIVCETVLIGIFALVLGIICGIALAQIMSFATATLFDLSMKQYAFLFSFKSVIRTITTFAILFVLVGIFNLIKINKTRLINLLSRSDSGNKHKELNVPLSISLFVLSLVILAFAYQLSTICMLFGTFLFFFSISNFAIFILKKLKRFSDKDLNVFNLRQITSRIQSAYVTLWAVCVILFFSITVFSTGLGLATIITGDIKESTLFDASLSVDYRDHHGDKNMFKPIVNDAKEQILKSAPELSKMIDTSVQVNIWNSAIDYEKLAKVNNVEFKTGFGEEFEAYKDQKVKLVSVDEVNAVRRMTKRSTIELKENQYSVINNDPSFDDYSNKVANSHLKIDIAGATLRADGQVIKQALGDSSLGYHHCLLVVPNSVATAIKASQIIPASTALNIKYSKAHTKQEIDKCITNIGDKSWFSPNSKLKEFSEEQNEKQSNYANIFSYTKTDVEGQSIGLKVLFVYLALYVGFVLLFAVASVLAVQQLCSTLDSTTRYRTLAQLGADRKKIFSSVFKQTAIYFLSPLILALCHFACAYFVLYENYFRHFVKGDLSALGFSVLIILAVYILYMFIAYNGSRRVIKTEVGYNLIS